jgi:F1F0 ATPase subunit 2
MNVTWIAAALLAGAGIGWLYFHGLWWTVRALSQRPHPAARVAISLLLRVALAAAGFVLLARAGGWPALVAALLGFLAARTVIVRLFGLRTAVVGEGR